MTEVTQYIADDGKVFEDEFECREYELINSKSGSIHDIQFFDENSNSLALELSDDFYNSIHKIIITSEEQVNALREISDLNGWCNEEINKPGTWVWLDKIELFIRIDDILEEYVSQIKWERDIAMRTLADIGIPFGHKYKDITDKMGMNSNGINLIAKLLNEGNARVIQIGGWDN